MKVLIVYYSTYGNVYRMATLVAEGVKEIPGAQPVVRTVPELIPKSVIDSREDMSPDFRKLKLTHNGAKVPDESTEIRKVHCEVFFPLPLATAESHCTALLGSSAQLFEPLQR